MAKSSAKKAASGTAPAIPSKTSAASSTFNSDIALLLQLASDAPALTFPQRKSAAKLFELAVLAELLLEYKAAPTNGTVRLFQPTNGNMDTFAGAPASANKIKYSWFELSDSTGAVEAEAWVSVQFIGLSATLAADNGVTGVSLNEKASTHELDLSLLRPEPAGSLPRLYPKYDDLIAGVSVKHVSSLAKESIREALGFRREMGYRIHGHGSTCAWLQIAVPCDPPTPLFLASSAENFEGYDGHIDELGIYAKYMKFPY